MSSTPLTEEDGARTLCARYAHRVCPQLDRLEAYCARCPAEKPSTQPPTQPPPPLQPPQDVPCGAGPVEVHVAFDAPGGSTYRLVGLPVGARWEDVGNLCPAPFPPLCGGAALDGGLMCIGNTKKEIITAPSSVRDHNSAVQGRVTRIISRRST